MSVKYYQLRFGTGNPAGFAGLAPTFTIFQHPGGSLLVPPGITEIPTATGLYYFTFGPTLPISFVVDGGAALSSSNRYITGMLDPIQAVDQKVGFDFETYGTTIGPSTLIGYNKRILQFFEGDQTFDKSTGAMQTFGKGSSTLLLEKTLTNTSGDVTKT